jgi:hypothetical protein
MIERIWAALAVVVLLGGQAWATGSGAVIPDLALQAPGARIGWTFGDLAGPARAAAADGKPVVVLVTAPGCAWCRAMLANAARCPTFNTLAGKAHFVMVGNREGGATGSMVGSFGVDRWPTVLVLTVRGSNAAERARGVGYMDEAALLQVMARGGLSPGAANPMAVSSVALGTSAPQGCLPGHAPPPASPPAVRVRASNGWAGLR